MGRILVVEDVEISRNIMGLMLKKFNCEVEMASCGLEAIKLAFTNKYDLIFMDLGLPDISGITVTKLIRNFPNESCASVPILALTAHVDVNYKQDCLSAGMNGFLLKPVSVQDIEDNLNQYVLARANC